MQTASVIDINYEKPDLEVSLNENHDFSNFLDAGETFGNRLEFKRDDFIYEADTAKKFVYIIAKGRIKIGPAPFTEKTPLLHILGPNDFFGTNILEPDFTSAKYAQAMDNDTLLYKIRAEDFEILTKKHTALNKIYLNTYHRRFKQIQKRFTVIATKGTFEVVKHVLKELSEDFSRKVGFETVIEGKISHKELAQLCGASRQTITTILNKLRKKDIIYFDSRKILIRDWEAL